MHRVIMELFLSYQTNNTNLNPSLKHSRIIALNTCLRLCPVIRTYLKIDKYQIISIVSYVIVICLHLCMYHVDGTLILTKLLKCNY